jgi:hypothetical protein
MPRVLILPTPTTSEDWEALYQAIRQEGYTTSYTFDNCYQAARENRFDKTYTNYEYVIVNRKGCAMIVSAGFVVSFLGRELYRPRWPSLLLWELSRDSQDRPVAV